MNLTVIFLLPLMREALGVVIFLRVQAGECTAEPTVLITDGASVQCARDVGEQQAHDVGTSLRGRPRLAGTSLRVDSRPMRSKNCASPNAHCPNRAPSICLA